jgi:hypothetical protein
MQVDLVGLPLLDVRGLGLPSQKRPKDERKSAVSEHIPPMACSSDTFLWVFTGVMFVALSTAHPQRR